MQPVPELAELSVRTSLDGSKIVLDSDQIKSGTLKRSPSKRLKQNVVSRFLFLSNQFMKNSICGDHDIFAGKIRKLKCFMKSKEFQLK